mgnify:CR=1 FL=1
MDLLDTNKLIETRPQLSNNNLREPLLKEIKHKEKNEEIKLIKTEKEEKKNTILDEKLGDILEKTSLTVANFWDNYKIKMLESKYDLENNNINFKKEDKDKISHILNIHINGLFNYLRDDNNIIYLGIFLIFISVLIYIFNIIR